MMETPLWLGSPHHACQVQNLRLAPSSFRISPILPNREMANEESSSQAYNEIKENGYFHVDNDEIGERFATPSDALTAESLTICIDHLDNVCHSLSSGQKFGNNTRAGNKF